MTIDPLARCGNCWFFFGANDRGKGKCRRYPPSPVLTSEDRHHSMFPEVYASADWCGEFVATNPIDPPRARLARKIAS